MKEIPEHMQQRYLETMASEMEWRADDASQQECMELKVISLHLEKQLPLNDEQEAHLADCEICQGRLLILRACHESEHTELHVN
jgi:hypothetical protein